MPGERGGALLKRRLVSAPGALVFDAPDLDLFWVPLNRRFVAQVYSIREAATKNLQRLAQEFGADWAKDHLVPKVLAMIKNPHYLYRMTVLFAVSMLAPVVGSDTVCNTMLPMIVGAFPCADLAVPSF